MIPFTMIVRHEFCDGPPEVAFTERHHPIETLFFDRPHEAFGVSIRVGRLDRRLHDADRNVSFVSQAVILIGASRYAAR
jgi:hypothetical protein